MYFEEPVIILISVVAAEPNCRLYLEYAVLIKFLRIFVTHVT